MSEVSTRPRNLSWAIIIIGLLLAFIGIYILNSANCSAMVPGVMAAWTTVLLGVLGLGRNHFSFRQAAEERAAKEYQRTHGKTELFDDADEAVRMATRANEQYVKYFVPFFTVALGLIMLFIGVSIWIRWGRMDAFAVAPRPLPMAILAVCCCIGTLIAGSFFVGASRNYGCRWLRPSGAWLFLIGFLYLLSGIALFLEYFQKALLTIDITMARVGMVFILLLALELLLSFIIEFYRPRMPGEEERPLPESRLLALFTEPGGVARNVAASLDYQFGFQVSEAWFYRFLERTVAPLFAIMLLAFWLQTCLVVVDIEYNGIREVFGKVSVQEPLTPGLYLKWPYPFARIYTFPVEHVQEITIGGHHKFDAEKHGHGKGESYDEQVILWDIKEQHSDESNFIVADDPEAMTRRESGKSEQMLSMGVISAHIPLYFKVRNLYDYAYRHTDAVKTLENVATRELIRYLAGASFADILGDKRHEAGTVINQRIQEASKEARLGIEVVFVSLAGLHPPPGVGAAFDNVVAAREMQFAEILQAETYALTLEPSTESAAIMLADAAEAYKLERTRVAEAEGERFLSQLKGYQAAPELYTLSTYLDVLLNEGRGVRKYILTGGMSQEVLILNLEKKLRSSLLDLNLDSFQNQ
jgi:regulator of protease activity HflC (stomatin/prohibitin superfamily)